MRGRRLVGLLRENFVLTPQEKKMVAFIAAMLLLGLATKEYRERYPRPPPAPVVQQQPRPKKSATPRVRKPKTSPKPKATPQASAVAK